MKHLIERLEDCIEIIEDITMLSGTIALLKSSILNYPVSEGVKIKWRRKLRRLIALKEGLTKHYNTEIKTLIIT